MPYRYAVWALGCAFFLLAAGKAASAEGEKSAPPNYRETRWEELIPPSWHPENAFAGLDINALSDDDPRAVKAMENFLAEWSKAPANPNMQGKMIRLPGFVAPLDWESSDGIKEFLLVPYFGACIHVPPPPANQIVYITMDRPLPGLENMAAIWVYGTISLERHEGDVGTSGYAMRVDRIEPYTEDRP